MPNLTKSELADLKDQINTFHLKGIEAAKWGIVYFINAGEGLRAVREGLPDRGFKPWLKKNFEFSRNTAYKYIKLAEEKGKIKELSVTHGLQIESMRKAFAVLGAYYEEESTTPITAIETPESATDDGSSMQSSEPASLANGAGGSPAPTEAEQAILAPLLKPGEMADFESGLDHDHKEYQCYLCKNWFLADQVKTLQGNRFCYSCRQQLPDATDGVGQSDDDDPDTAPAYETTLFDEVPHEVPPDTLPGANGHAPSTRPPPMTQKDPYDEMIMLALELFPLLSSMECMSTYGINGRMRRFIDLFKEIHRL